MPPAALAALRAVVARPEPAAGPHLPLGHALLDNALPGGGLRRGALHEIAGDGAEAEHATAATLFTAGILARLCAEAPGPVLWVLHRRDLFAPALAGAGLHPDRVIYAEVFRPADVLLALEDALHHRGLAGVAGEFSGKFSLTASRRLQLAAEKGATPCFLLRRSRRHDDPLLREPCAAVTRWRLASLPAPPPLPEAPDVPGLAPPRWRLDLVRCRGGEPKTWVVEAFDAQGRLGVPELLPHRPAADERPADRRAA